MGTKLNAQLIDGLALPVNTLAELAVLDPTDIVNLNTVRICSDSTPPNLVWCNGTIWVAADDGLTAA
jgi:hypothetical protein